MARNLRGLEHARRVFRDVPPKFQEKIVAALNKGAEEIADRARLLAPHDPTTPIDLRDQIKTLIGLRRNARSPRVLNTASPNSIAAYVIAGDTKERFYAAVKQEFGRPAGPGNHPGHPAQPFMFPAYFSIRNRVRNRVRRAMRAAAKEMARQRSGGNR
ncbi:MAG: HK97 gp10 family phage protein [Pseudomonadota bacterium]